MKELADRLLIADKTACGNPEGNIALVCGCRSCWQRYSIETTGLTALPRAHPGYLHFEGDSRLYLKLSNSPEPVYPVRLFQIFLDWTEREWLDGKTVVIHSVDGIGRAPTLAMLFMAKRLGALPDSYDAAWDAMGDWYKPCEGLEEWMRKAWGSFERRPVSYIKGAADSATEKQELPAEDKAILAEASSSTITAEQAIEIARMSPLVHFAAFARIEDKQGVLTPAEKANDPSVMQAKVCAAYEWLTANKMPVRIIIGPKARQSYGSTITAEIVYHHSRRNHCNGIMIADENDRTDQIWKMFNNMARSDRFGRFWDSSHEANQEKATFTYREDGKARTFDWLRDTASDAMAGSAGTRQCIWFSEAGRYGKQGMVTDAQVIQNASASVPDAPGTVIIMESVSGGPVGYFFETCKGAVTLEQRMAGEYGNGWVKVFCGWHEVPDYRLERRSEFEELFSERLDDRETRGVQLYGWTAEQIAWRRNALRKTYAGNEAAFDRELPESEEVAFHSGGTPRFDPKGTARLQAQAKTGHGLARLGVIEENNGKVMIVDDRENPWLWMREEPMFGGRYIVFGDFMTGEQSAGSKKRDGHACGVLRDGYIEYDGTVHNPKLVAALHNPKGKVMWDSDIIAKRAHLLSRVYGNCIIGLEVNEALGILSYLKTAGANLWKRTKNDEVAPGQTLNIEGWKTTGATRPKLIDAMAKAVREQAIDISYEPMVRQITIFESRGDGKCAAPTGEHDDWVMGGALGLVLINNATELVRPIIRPPTAFGESSADSGRYGTHALA